MENKQLANLYKRHLLDYLIDGCDDIQKPICRRSLICWDESNFGGCICSIQPKNITLYNNDVMTYQI